MMSKISKKGAILLAISVACCAAIVLVPPTWSSALTYPGFMDVEQGAWYAESVSAVNAAGYMPYGYGGKFEPSKPATTGELAYLILKCDQTWVRTATKDEAVSAPYLEEISRRVGETVEDGELTRMQAVKMICKALDLPTTTSLGSPFEDTQDPCVVTAYEAGLIGGVRRDGLSYFDGEEPMTRAQVIVIGRKLMDLCALQEVAPTEDSFKSKLYDDISNIGLCLDPATPAPVEPKTVQDFRQALQYMMVNGLAECSFDYQNADYETLKAETVDTLTKAMRSIRYERSEYFSYFLKASVGTRRNADGSCTVTIKLSTPEYTVDTLLNYREAAFKAAYSNLQNLYDTGKLKVGMTETERAKVITEFVSNTTQYKDNEDRLDHTAWSVFNQKTGVCDGYSSALQLMLSLDNIRCWGQYGRVREVDKAHQWVIAELDGKTLGIDPTLYSAKTPKYFGMDENTINKTYLVVH